MTSEQNFQKEIDSWKPKRCENPWKPNMFNGQSEVSFNCYLLQIFLLTKCCVLLGMRCLEVT